MNLLSAAGFVLLAYSPTVLADACTTSSDCGIGGVCARSEADATAGLVCCASGDSEYISTVPYPRNVCTGLAAGLQCGGDNDVCASGVCGMDDVCKEEKIGDENSCRNDDQCASGKCARSEADATAGLVCCASGDSEYISSVPNPRYVCTGLAAGLQCGGDNDVCASGVCGMDNVCKEEKIGDENSCRNDAQCASGECARSEADATAGLVCCASGDSEYISSVPNPRYVCTGRAAGLQCGGDNDVCASGVCGMDDVCEEEKIGDESSCRNNDQCASGKCARSEADATAGLVCCASGDSEYISSVPNPRYVCTGLAAGLQCGGDNDVCASGVCGMDDVCKEEKIGDESSCRNDAQCASGECARSEADATAGLVCCPNGDSEYISSVPNPRYVCTGRAAGLQCGGDNDLCRSGSCDSNELCTRQLVGSSCNGENSDCVNDSCGRVEALQDAKFVCCPSGQTIVGGSDLSVCTNIGEENQACFDDSICKSSVCVLGVCKGSKQELENEPCEKNAHCASGSCENQDSNGLGSCGPFASLAAKNDYFNDSADCPLNTIVPPDVNDMSTVTLQVYGDIAKTSWADFISNMIREKFPDSSATANVIVGQEVTDGIDGCFGGSSVVAQRQGNQVCFGYQKEDDDGDGNSSFTCSKKCINIGSSGSLETYDKSDVDITGGFFGVPMTTYYFGESRVCRVAVKSGGAATPVAPPSNASKPTSKSTSSPVALASPTSASGGAATPVASPNSGGTGAATLPSWTTETTILLSLLTMVYL